MSSQFLLETAELTDAQHDMVARVQRSGWRMTELGYRGYLTRSPRVFVSLFTINQRNQAFTSDVGPWSSM